VIVAAAIDRQPHMLDSIRQRISALKLDLSGLSVVTEAATGAYSATAVIAAVAGSRHVTALARDTSRHGSALDAAEATLALARRAGVSDRIEIVREVSGSAWADCDVLTNCGHLRPINRAIVEQLPARAVIGLMYEAWEFRGADIDLGACRGRGIRIAAVNERHPDVAVFPFLGPLSVRLLQDAGFDVKGRRVAVLCDNPFAQFLRDGLAAAESATTLCTSVGELPTEDWDAVVVALNPANNPALASAELNMLAKAAPGALLGQFWGDIDRAAARAAGFTLAPTAAPKDGHMGILLNELGPEPIIRLQTGGLRAAELVFRGNELSVENVAQLL
jgi:hypothetical protein